MQLKFTKTQWFRLSEILGNLGLVFFAGVVLPYILGNKNLITIVAGLILSFTSWMSSLIIAKKI